MMDLYTWATPNGRKVSIALEELGLDYQVYPVNIGADEQFAPDFLALSPNNKIPVLVDHSTAPAGSEPRVLIESGAILIYLAETTGQLQGDDRWLMLQWVMLQMASIGPMFGQTHHFHKFKPDSAPYAEERFLSETHRLYGVLDKRLTEVEFLAGSYSMADIASFPWVARWPWHDVEWTRYPALARWFATLAERDAVQRGYNVPASSQVIELPR